MISLPEIVINDTDYTTRSYDVVGLYGSSQYLVTLAYLDSTIGIIYDTSPPMIATTLATGMHNNIIAKEHIASLLHLNPSDTDHLHAAGVHNSGVLRKMGLYESPVVHRTAGFPH